MKVSFNTTHYNTTINKKTPVSFKSNVLFDNSTYGNMEIFKEKFDTYKTREALDELSTNGKDDVVIVSPNRNGLLSVKVLWEKDGQRYIGESYAMPGTLIDKEDVDQKTSIMEAYNGAIANAGKSYKSIDASLDGGLGKYYMYLQSFRRISELS